MAANLVKKILGLIPALALLCLISFILLQYIPGDPVLSRLQASGVRISSSENVYDSREYTEMRRGMRLHLPAFYFAIQPASVSEKLRDIAQPDMRRTMKKWCIRYGNAEKVDSWYTTHQLLQQYLVQKKRAESWRVLRKLTETHDIAVYESTYQWLLENADSPEEQKLILQTATNLKSIPAYSQGWKSYWPTLRWNGTANQFHHWLFGQPGEKGLLAGALGTSLRDGRPVADKVIPALKTTLPLAAIALLLMYTVAVPLGLRLSRIQNKSRQHIFVRLIFMVYAMPGFWLGVLLLTFLCSPDFLNWFPVAYSLMEIDPGMNAFERIGVIVYHLILPVTAWSAGGTAFLTLQIMKRSEEIHQQPFILAVKAKGLGPAATSRRHVAKNAMIPAVSMLGALLPASISGAIAIELIFSIPGMGQLIFDAFHNRDFPVVMAVLLLVGLIAILGTTCADLINRFLDPRVRVKPTAA